VPLVARLHGDRLSERLGQVGIPLAAVAIPIGKAVVGVPPNRTPGPMSAVRSSGMPNRGIPALKYALVPAGPGLPDPPPAGLSPVIRSTFSSNVICGNNRATR
jgi:hypothetical protein